MNNNNDYCVQKRNLQVSKKDETKMSKSKLARFLRFANPSVELTKQPRPQALSFSLPMGLRCILVVVYLEDCLQCGHHRCI